jgi:hypothetical protein
VCLIAFTAFIAKMARISLVHAPASVKTSFAFVIIQLAFVVLLIVLGVTFSISFTPSSTTTNTDFQTVTSYVTSQSAITVALAAAIPMFIVGVIGFFACIFWETNAFVPLNIVSIVFNSLAAAETLSLALGELVIYGFVNVACFALYNLCTNQCDFNCQQCPFSSQSDYNLVCVSYPRSILVMAVLVILCFAICLANAIIGCVLAAARRRNKETIVVTEQITVQPQPAPPANTVVTVVEQDPAPQPVLMAPQPVLVAQPMPTAQPMPVAQTFY